MRKLFLTLVCTLSCALSTADLNAQKMQQPNRLDIAHISSDFPISDLTNEGWKKADLAAGSRYWSGKQAPAGRRFNARLLWSNNYLYVRFEARQAEPLVIAEEPKLDAKTMNLWDRDVVEIFVAPDRNEARKYFEFEVAPTGEWIDVELDSTSGKRVSNWKYASEMESAAKIEAGKVTAAMRIPWEAFGKRPKAGDVWLGNLLRCVGKDPGRGYLAWSPTMTGEPNFHVPAKFGEFVFVK